MADTDVIDIEEAKTAINGTSIGPHAAKLEMFVSAVSERLDALCGPIVVRTVTEVCEPRGGHVFLASWPVDSITTVTEYVSGVPTVLTAEDIDTSGGYLVQNGIVTRRSGFAPSMWSGRVQVVYEAGRYASTEQVEARFRLAACEIIAREWPQYAGAWARGGDPFGGGDEASIGYFKSVKPVVDQWLAADRLPPNIA